MIYRLTKVFSITATLLLTASVQHVAWADIQKTTLLDSQSQIVSVDFVKLLQESGLSFSETKGFKSIPVAPDYVMPYEKRLTNQDESLEVRYAIRPLNRIEIAYDDPHNSAPHPNDLFEMLFRTLSETLSGGSHVISRAYTAEQAKQKYNAGWASVGVFDISPDISKRYKQAMLIAIHHNDKADAYLLMLTNNLADQKPAIKQLQKSLKFTLFEKGINTPE